MGEIEIGIGIGIGIEDPYGFLPQPERKKINFDSDFDGGEQVPNRFGRTRYPMAGSSSNGPNDALQDQPGQGASRDIVEHDAEATADTAI